MPQNPNLRSVLRERERERAKLRKTTYALPNGLLLCFLGNETICNDELLREGREVGRYVRSELELSRRGNEAFLRVSSPSCCLRPLCRHAAPSKYIVQGWAKRKGCLNSAKRRHHATYAETDLRQSHENPVPHWHSTELKNLDWSFTYAPRP